MRDAKWGMNEVRKKEGEADRHWKGKKKKKWKKEKCTDTEQVYYCMEKAIRVRIIVLVAGNSLHLLEVAWRKERIEIHTCKERGRVGDYSTTGTPDLSVCQHFIVCSTLNLFAFWLKYMPEEMPEVYTVKYLIKSFSAKIWHENLLSNKSSRRRGARCVVSE